MLSILCARWLEAEHVAATDGNDGVVEALETNLFLNGLQDSERISSRSLKWGRALDEGESGEQSVVDVVIGADIVSLILFPEYIFMCSPGFHHFLDAETTGVYIPQVLTSL